MNPNLSRPESIGVVEPAVFERLLDEYQGQTKPAVQFPGFFTKTPSDNDEVLDAFGSFKQDVVDYAQDAHKRLVKRVHYVADLRDAKPGRQQRQTSWHTERVPNGTTILAASALPTLFIVQKDLEADVSPYLESLYLEGSDSSIYTAGLIGQGVDDGVLEKYAPQPGEMIELNGRIHCSPFNATGEIVRRAFLACEITFKK